MDKRKKLVTIVSAAIIITAIFTPLLFVKTVAAADPTDWYMTVNGVLDSDTYLLYPYASESLKVGLSKFGELINSNTNVGLEYAGARDPFAAPAGSSIDEGKLPKKVWINGWYIDIRYVHEDWGPRNVWAGALFADKNDYGKNWIRVDNDYTKPLHPVTESDETFDDKGLELNGFTPIPGLVNGGRKTNGTAITEPITVLYDGPRLFVAMSVTHIYDWHEETDENLHLVDVVLTIMFNKVKKEVVVIKDVKMIDQAKFVIADLPITLPQGEGDGEITIPMALLVQFSNREEWDLGAKNVAGTIDYSSYVHFYTAGNGEGQDTVYNKDWTMLPTLPAGVKYGGEEINAWGPEPSDDGTYDVAQIISNDKKYVGWHAFWPSLSDWSADAARGSVKTWYRAMTGSDPHYTDAYNNVEPFLSPLIVGEWDFILADREEEVGDGINIGRQFRGVSVYGVTDLHDGDDTQLGESDVLDTETLYQLNEVFNPWDLVSAVYKDTKRWVEWKAATASTTFTTSHANVVPVEDDEWDDYCVFSERVIDLTENELEARVGYNWMGQDTYTVTYNEDGTMTISGLDANHAYKILYSTCEADEPGRYEWIIVGRDAATVDSAGAALAASAFKDKIIESEMEAGAFIGLAGADMYDPLPYNQMPWVMHKFGTGNTWQDYYYSGTDYRTALRDDWCKAGTVSGDEWPVASSNMIGVGGPLANLLAYYGNDFAQAIYGLSDGTKYGDFTNFAAWEDHIIPLTCWDITKTKTYSSTNTTGYAVISTYKDINGTVLFLVWGHWGRDTYYASKWLHEEGIYELQDAPRGLTAIILKFTYESTGEGYKVKSWSIVECLGTISETEWTHGSIVKGGIHDP